MNKKNKDLVINNYKEFCQLEGCDYIASEFALETILNLIITFKVNKILEIGLGIGCIADTVIKYSKLNNKEIEYYGTENNDFCLSVLPNNVLDFEKIKLFSELKDIQPNTFDLIIIDGSDDSLTQISKHITKPTILFIEGGRDKQTKTLTNLFPKHCYVNVITLKKNPPYIPDTISVNSYIGGGQLIFVNPNFKMKLFYAKEKIKTFLKNKIRTFQKNKKN